MTFLHLPNGKPDLSMASTSPSSLLLGLSLLLLLTFSNAVTSISSSPESNPKQLTAPNTEVRGRKEINYIKSNIGVRKLGTIDPDLEKLGGGGAKVGGRKKIKDVKSNKEVQDLGKFSVDEFNKNHQTHIAFSKVVKAESQVVAGIKYYLKIEAVEDGVKKAYDAEVVVKAWLNSKELLSFAPSHLEKLGGGGAKVGGRKEIKDVKSNKEVQDLGKFSVDEFNKNHQTHIAFSEVVKAESQVVAGIKYYLKIEAVEDGVKKAYDAEVVVKAWLNSKELLSFAPSHQ